MKTLTVLISAVCFITFLPGQEQLPTTTQAKRIYKATKINPHPPEIDGKLNDAIWKKCFIGENFTQMEPNEGEPASQKTSFKMAYDDKNIYVGIRARDAEPGQIIQRVARRDQGDEADMVAVLIDSYFDHRTAFEFAVNAAGVKIDGIWSDDGDNQDYSYDPVWEVKTTIDSEGWTAEMRIPLSQIRYGNKDEQTWGLQVGRYLHRNQEWSGWQFIPQDAGGYVSQMGELQGISGIKSSRRIELLPYTVGQASFFEEEADNPFSTGSNGKFAGGLDGKIGITSDLTMDFTVNPDFGQVEADPSEVNLSAFETFFPEKRPFFIEGKNIFNYTLGWGDGSFSRETLFYSRRLGRQPQHSPDLDDDEYARIPENTSIIAAAKVTGKTSGGLSVGILDAVTARETAEMDINSERSRQIVEPETNYFVGRLQKDFQRGNTSIGGIITATNRNFSQSHLNFLNKAAYSGGLDLNHQWHNKNYFLNISTAISRIEGSSEAILEAQTASQRYYQRPDADYITLDSTRTSLSGNAGSLAIGKIGGGHWRFVAGGIWRTPGFEINDIGFLRSADRMMAYSWIAYREWNPKWIFRRFQINQNLWSGWNFGGDNIFTGGNINGGGQFKNYWGFWAGINREGEDLQTSLLRGGPMMRTPGAWNNWFRIFSDDRKAIQVSTGMFNSFNDDNISRRNSFFTDITWHPDKAMAISVEPSYSFNNNNLQYVSTETSQTANEDRYILGRINQKTFAMEFRLNYSITPALSIQYWGQPFISNGQYTQFKRVTNPRADVYENRFHTLNEEIRYNSEVEIYEIDENLDGSTDYTFDDPDFNIKEFRSNLVLRWEYLPGSTIFLVWSQNRTASSSDENFTLADNIKGLFDIHPVNVFLIKFNYWFNF